MLNSTVESVRALLLLLERREIVLADKWREYQRVAFDTEATDGLRKDIQQLELEIRALKEAMQVLEERGC